MAESSRTEPRNHAGEGDERIRTAVPSLGADSAYERQSAPELVRKHRGLASAIASEFFLPGGDRDDVEQEALIALWEAARSYDRESGEFPPFAGMVIRRRLRDALKAARRLKHDVLTSSERVVLEGSRFGRPVFVSVLTTLPGGRDPVDILIDKERVDRVRAAVARLRPVEREALALAVNGVRYSRRNPGPGGRRVENLVSRARGKVRRLAA